MFLTKIKKRKVDEEERVLQVKLEIVYFCGIVGIMFHLSKRISVPKEYNLRNHYETNH